MAQTQLTFRSENGKPNPIFRRQALEHAGIRRYGTVVLARPVSYAALTLLFVLISAGIVAFLVTFSYQRKIHVTGVVLPEAGLIRVVSSQVGIIAELKVREGQTVQAGDPLFVLQSDRASVTRGDAEKTISDLLQIRRQSLVVDRAQLHQQSVQRAAAARRKADELAKDIGRIDDQTNLQQRRVALAQEALKRFSVLQGDNFVSDAQVQNKQAELLDQRERLADLERAKAASERDLAAVLLTPAGN